MRPRAPSGPKETASDEFRPLSPKARVRRKVPGLFVLPRWRNRRYAHVSETCSSGFESRVGYQIFLPLRHSDRIKRNVLLQLGMWQETGRHGSTGRARRCQRREAGSRPAACPNRFRRLRVRTAAFQAANAGSTPAGNATGTSLNGRAFALHANNMGSNPIVSTNSNSL